MELKIRVLHAGIVETARHAHPRLGHKLDPETWLKVFSDIDFQQGCTELFQKKAQGGFFRKPDTEAPNPPDYAELADFYLESLTHWEKWGSVKAFFYTLDAENALDSMVEGAWLSELVSDVLMEELEDQAARGYVRGV